MVEPSVRVQPDVANGLVILVAAILSVKLVVQLCARRLAVLFQAGAIVCPSFAKATGMS